MPISHAVALLRGHLLVASIVAVAVALTGGVFAFARPANHPEVMKPPPDHGLPYTVVKYTAADARRAFAAVDVRLTPRSSTPTIVTQGSRGDVLEVDAFGDRDKVEAAGFWNYTTSGGRYVRFPKTCGTAIPSAERWHGNVRVIVSCTRAGASTSAWFGRVDRALALLR